MKRVLNRLRHLLFVQRHRAPPQTPQVGTCVGDPVARYWTEHNVSSHRSFTDAADSLAYFEWRNHQYFNYIDLMPVHGQVGKVVLDYGCGPGHDLVGFAEYSSPRRLIGMDVSATSIREARDRLALHRGNVELLTLDPEEQQIPLADASVDYIHCSGVLHHMADPERILREFRRILRPDGELRIMVYNRASLWMHLYCAYHIRIAQGRYCEFSLEQTFAKSTDGETCPISGAYDSAEMVRLARKAGLALRFTGAAVSAFEMSMLESRFTAIMHPDLPKESRRFLLELEMDERGLPVWMGVHAGVDACFAGRIAQDSETLHVQ